NKISSFFVVNNDTQYLQKIKVTGEPVLKLSFSQNVIEHIANLGKVIMTNLIDGNSRQVTTQPTPNVSSKNKTQHRADLTHFQEFHEMLRSFTRKSGPIPIRSGHAALNSIGIVTAPMVITPPPHFDLYATREFSRNERLARRRAQISIDFCLVAIDA
ncbi:hypothetical protein PFISCL1PPCAC_21479, partial [Pristionchus fissidentatus]